MSDVNIANVNVPRDGEKWVMECTLEVECKAGQYSERVSFSGFAIDEVVGAFLDIARKVVGE